MLAVNLKLLEHQLFYCVIKVLNIKIYYLLCPICQSSVEVCMVDQEIRYSTD